MLHALFLWFALPLLFHLKKTFCSSLLSTLFYSLPFSSQEWPFLCVSIKFGCWYSLLLCFYVRVNFACVILSWSLSCGLWFGCSCSWNVYELNLSLRISTSLFLWNVISLLMLCLVVTSGFKVGGRETILDQDQQGAAREGRLHSQY